MSSEKYWMDQCAKKDARINELTDRLVDAHIEGSYYKGLYIGIKEIQSEVVVVDETFDDILKEGEPDDSDRA